MRQAFLVIALAACSSATGPTISVLKNDGFVSGAPTFIAAFASGEGAAAKLGPESTDFTIRSVQFLFGGSDTAKTVTLTIYADDGGTDNPGAVLYSHDYPLTPSSAGFQQIDLTAQHMAVASGHSIRVAVLFQHAGLPSVAKDGDGITSSRNYILSGTWSKAETLGVDGDFIIRAEIEH